MKTKLLLLFFLVTSIVIAQEKTVSGVVSDESGGLPGVSILIKGTTKGTETDFDGNYSIKAKENDILIFSFVGMTTIEKTVGSSNVISVTMSTNENVLDEVVVTALGIKREKKSLGYATQEIKGNDLTKVNSGNIANSISGKISGVQIRRNGNIGGSTNVIIRGTTSLTGNNQALWVVDGVPLNNDNTNTADQKSGGNTGGYDFGNAVADINPDDIETMNVLKGAAASALYGSRATNGVIIITTKKGGKSKGLGITINSGVTIGAVDFKTLPKYQKEYGSGWWNSFSDPSRNIDLGSGSHPYEPTDDASWGPAYDPNLLVYRWNSFFPELSTYGKATPWTAPKNDANSFYTKSITFNNNISISGNNEVGSFRFSYSKYDLNQGILPNSSYKRDNFNLSGSYKLSNKTTVTASANYNKTHGKGLNETGYGAGGNNYLSSVRQWYSSSVDFADLKTAYKETQLNTTWSVYGPYDLNVAFHDNPYFQRKNNIGSIRRNRFFGNFSLTTEIKDWLSVTGRGGIDSYNQTQEETIAVGSKRQPELKGQYSRFDKNFREFNLDLIFNAQGKITNNISFTALLGGNVRRTKSNYTYAITKGGLVIPNIYAINNSVQNPDPLSESISSIGTNSIYTNASLSFYDTYFLEATYRVDQSSTLPKENNVYNYPSLTATYIFSKHLKANWLSFGKLRLNYAETGNDAPFAVLNSQYIKYSNFGDAIQFSTENSRKNPNLRSEKTKGYEIGLETKMFNNKLGLDLSLYKTNTTDQIMSVGVTGATGSTSAWVNAGNVENKGIEVSLNATPIKTDNFTWESQINWSTNKNKVISLNENDSRFEIGRFQGVSLVAEVGKPVGQMVSSGFKYINNQKVIKENGYYDIENSKIIGDINPDWIGGINNKFKYKDFSFSFLIDVKKGGDVWSLDQKYGAQTGIYQSSVGNNHLGNPKRNSVTNDENSGGIILDGVLSDGTRNTKIVPVDYDLGANTPDEGYVYDASFVKLREVSFSYNLPKKFLKNTFLNSLSFTASGSNLWIIHKNLPYADPEAGASSGNLQGFQTGVLPTTKEYSFNIKAQF